MIYLDYAAHTSINKEVYDAMYDISNAYIGSVNADYSIGIDAKNKYIELSNDILSMSSLLDYELILNSSATESNNLAIKGICDVYKMFGNHIITTPIEHSSVKGSINSMLKNNFEVDYVKLDKYGYVDINDLRKLIKPTTILVSISAVSSETGHIQNISNISEIIKSTNSNIKFHIDATQGYGKINLPLNSADLITASAHKIFGPTSGCGVLFRKNGVLLSPQIDGGKSMTIYRSATPDLVMLAAFHKSSEMMFNNIEENFNKVKQLSNIIIEYCKKNDIIINSDLNNPYIINISTKFDGEALKNHLSQLGIYVSTKSSCVAKKSIPESVNNIYNDSKRAKNSLRISLSYKTTIDEISIFLEKLDEVLTNGKI